MRRIVGVGILALLGVVALANVASASFWWWHQPKAPKALLDRR